MAISSVTELMQDLWPAGARLLDIGCGNGEVVRLLTALGYRMTGAEPQAERIAEARAKVPGAEFLVAGAEALPFGDHHFDGALMVQSLHHVPEGLMQVAMAEALRCIVPGGYLAVVEPIAEGSFFEFLRVIDDETEVRAAAQRALESACGSGLLRRHSSHYWIRREVYRDAGEIAAKLVANDPVRKERASTLRPELDALFRQAGCATSGGRELEHSMRADVFTAGQPGALATV